MDVNLLLSTILMLKKSLLKNYLFKVMINLNKLKIKNHFDESIKINILTDDIIKDIHIFLENMDEWIRNYNSEMRISMKRELIINLAEIKIMFKKLETN
jgi:hypothetical protein